MRAPPPISRSGCRFTVAGFLYADIRITGHSGLEPGSRTGSRCPGCGDGSSAASSSGAATTTDANATSLLGPISSSTIHESGQDTGFTNRTITYSRRRYCGGTGRW